MNISINKDIEKYQESVIMGLTAKQLICSIIALALGTGIVLSTFKYVGLTVSVYIAIPIVAPIALNGFYEYQGMSFTEMMKRKIRCYSTNPGFLFTSSHKRNLETSLLTIRQFLLHHRYHSYFEQVAGLHHQDSTKQYTLYLGLLGSLGTLPL